ncbi:MAG: N-acetylmuramoyl-L-alanine amidase [candidate division WOR-3 bacterium]
MLFFLNFYSYGNFGYIVIDPGHGGKDPGAIGKWGIKEKDITLSVSKKIANILKKEYGFKVILTREEDIFLSLSERAEIAKRYNAKLFVSIDCNYFEMSNIKGPEVFFLSNESRKLAFFINQRINEFTKSRGITKANFYLLRNIYIPSVIIEIGYVSNPEEANLLIDKNYQYLLARGIAEGIREYVNWYISER